MSSNTIDPCPHRQWYAEHGARVAFLAYYVCSPVYFVLGTLSHAVCLKAFYRKSKTEKAYLYQIYVSVSELLEVFSWIMYVVGFEWMADPRGHGFSWYHSCYACMWFSAKMGTFLINVFITMSEMFSICMSADRLYALWKPTQYDSVDKNMNIKIAAAMFCIITSVSTSVQNCFVFYVEPASTDDKSTNSTVYQLVGSFDPAWINATTVARNGLQAVGLLSLYLCNIGLVWLYRLRQKQASRIQSDDVRKRRQEAEKTLAQLTIVQCTCMTLSTTSTIIFNTVISYWPSFYSCTGPFYMPARDAYLQVIDILDFIFVIAINKRFRLMILKEFRCVGAAVTPSTAPIPVNSSSRARGTVNMRR